MIFYNINHNVSDVKKDSGRHMLKLNGEFILMWKCMGSLGI